MQIDANAAHISDSMAESKLFIGTVREWKMCSVAISLSRCAVRIEASNCLLAGRLQLVTFVVPGKWLSRVRSTIPN